MAKLIRIKPMSLYLKFGLVHQFYECIGCKARVLLCASCGDLIPLCSNRGERQCNRGE